MNKLSLDGKWRLYFHAEDGDLPETIDAVKKAGWKQIEAVVPGNVELDLQKAGLEADPYYGNNLYSYRKYEFYQWWFERDFEVPRDFSGKAIDLVLHGLDTYGSIWINGCLVGETANMLIEKVLDITKAVRAGAVNHIAIRIKSAVNMARNRDFPVGVNGGKGDIDEMAWIRKPPHSFGWDIAPRILSAGIWRGIEIAVRKSTRIKEVYYATRWVKDEEAMLVVKYRFTTDEVFLDNFTIRIHGVCNGHRFEQEQRVKFCSYECSMIINNPQLWWPKGYGPANLYEVTFTLFHNGKEVDRRQERIGIRQIELERKYLPGDDGEFKISVNGCPILAKGSNWVPLDALHSKDKERLQRAHDLFEDTGCNIIRCWGGNVYEDHDFFDLCDARGMLVWQDFAMACGIYPQNDEFARMIEEEAAAVVKKLRNHASLLLWAGDNEIDSAYYWNGYHLSHARYNRISREILARVVGAHDPFRNYIPSSPYIPEHMSGYLNVPEQHNWGPRDYFKGDFYKHSSAHFISEVGYHGCPAVSSIKKFIAPEKLWPYQNNDQWDTHNTDYLNSEPRVYNRNELMANQVKILFGGIPENLHDFTLASQISQAEAQKFFIETVRVKKWRKTGIIWWNMLDCWPQFSDAVVDYYFTKKLAYHYIKRIQVPTCMMLTEPENWQYQLMLTNDSRTGSMVKYTVTDGDSGEILLAGEHLTAENGNLKLGTIKALPGEQRLFLIQWEMDGVRYGNHYVSGYVPFDFPKYLVWLEKIKILPQPFSMEE
jgi:beta-mannosidase